MPLSVGSRLGPYEILAPLGAGGMGEVYRARDTRLERTVAIKVLPQHLSADPALRQRFEREARAASKLNHPHICTVHDVGSHAGVDYLVLELLEGETLSVRLGRGPLPVDDALGFAIQIADALDRAHRQGLIHRDIKPGNVMLTATGAKLLDFGLAKSAGAEAGASTHLNTATSLTAAGSIIGTFQYMAPEQIEGQEADARSDIFAFGLVLYEMVTGQRAFQGKTQASLVAAILEREPPPITTLAPTSPPALDRLVRTCLAKDPEKRRQTMQDVLLDLRWIAEGGTPVPAAETSAPSRRPIGREIAAWSIAAVLLVAAAVLGLAYRQAASVVPQTVRAFVTPPEGGFLFSFAQGPGGAGPPALSPDGRQIAMVVRAKGGVEQLMIRPVDSLVSRPLPGTEGARYPFWSPDSRSVGFFADGKLKKVEATGGPSLTLCAAPMGRGGSWSPQGVIVFTPDRVGPIHRVSDAGGASSPVTAFDSATDDSHRWPWFLPDGRRFVYLDRVRGGQENLELNSLMIGALDRQEATPLLKASSNVAYGAGHLFFVFDRTLMAQPFDAQSAGLSGGAFPIADGIQFDAAYSHGVFTVSGNGVLAYQTGTAGNRGQLVWFDRSGKQLGAVGSQARYNWVELSPSGRRAVVEIADERTGDVDLWIYDLMRTPNLRTRFTFEPGVQSSPRWSPDEQKIVYTSRPVGRTALFVRPVSGTGDQVKFLETGVDDIWAGDWSADGRLIVFSSLNAKTGSDLWTVPASGDPIPAEYLRTPNNERRPAFSPDGRWVAYESLESNRNEIYIAPFPRASRKWLVSSNGGVLPRWRADGKELFYVDDSRRLTAVEIQASSDDLVVGSATPLFELRLASPVPIYAVTRDGQRFLVNSLVEDVEESPLTLVVNWIP